ncbi:MAG: S41 family peptidase [Bacteroidaceae bacterium]|nr:S41 family peptidase [Bacteroidaceae bacterium]
MKKAIYVAIALLTTLCAPAQTVQERTQLNLAVQKIGTTLMAIKGLYIDTTNIAQLTDETIKSILAQLDPHSSYSTAEETKKLTEPLNSNFEGIGVQFNVISDTLVVIQPVSKGPSEKAGIIAGDRIISVNDTAIAGVKMPREQMMKRLRGPKGTEVMLGIKRRGVDETLQFRIIRDKIPLHSVDAAYMIRPDVGIIHLANFASSTQEELHEAIINLKKKGMQSLILDLQQNGGGYLEAASAVASEFLQKGDLVVYTDGRSVPKQRSVASGKGIFTDGRLIILVDEYTASAAEIVSGAVQDHDRGTIIGRRTFGKGLVQRPIELPDGSMVRLTVSHYYTPAGRCIQKPYVKGQKKEYDLDMVNRLNNGELMHLDSIHFADSLKCYTLKQHRTIYGGGGIMPDVFVPLDTTVYTNYYRTLSRKNVILDTYMPYFDNNRKQLASEYKKFEKFRESFEVPQALLDSIVSRGEKMDVRPADEAERIQTIDRLKIILKGLFARDLWELSEYYAIVDEHNDIIKRALQQLDSEKQK